LRARSSRATLESGLLVGAVLEGSVAKAGNRVRITAQLIDTANGYHLWSDSYDRNLQDVLAIRSEVAQTVAKALQVTLEAGERQLLEQKPTENLEAYQLYLKGLYAITT
jgi:TolB-like protein